MHTSSKAVLIVIGVVLALLIGLAIGAVVWANQQLTPLDPANTQNVLFIIPKGASTSDVAASLVKKGLIRNDMVFRLSARQASLDRDLQAGSYELSPSLSIKEIISVFQEGSQAIWVTLPEGLRVEEVAERFAAADLPEFDSAEFIALAKPSEGRLFPDTYLVPRESTAEQLFTLLTRTFRDKVEVKLAGELQQSERSLEEVIVMASLIQRESNSPDDMKKVAGVITNRLNIGMKLDIDATLSYLRGFDTVNKSWWSAPNISLKSIDSPFNTYQIAGLPPSPIANPGLEAIQAALDPDPHPALFYLHTPAGQAYYADTLNEHTANIERYLR